MAEWSKAEDLSIFLNLLFSRESVGSNPTSVISCFLVCPSFSIKVYSCSRSGLGLGCYASIMVACEGAQTGDTKLTLHQGSELWRALTLTTLLLWSNPTNSLSTQKEWHSSEHNMTQGSRLYGRLRYTNPPLAGLLPTSSVVRPKAHPLNQDSTLGPGG